MSDDTTPSENASEQRIDELTEEVQDLQARVDRLEREMGAIGKMEGAIKRIFKGGEPTETETEWTDPSTQWMRTHPATTLDSAQVGRSSNR